METTLPFKGNGSKAWLGGRFFRPREPAGRDIPSCRANVKGSQASLSSPQAKEGVSVLVARRSVWMVVSVAIIGASITGLVLIFDDPQTVEGDDPTPPGTAEWISSRHQTSRPSSGMNLSAFEETTGLARAPEAADRPHASPLSDPQTILETFAAAEGLNHERFGDPVSSDDLVEALERYASVGGLELLNESERGASKHVPGLAHDPCIRHEDGEQRSSKIQNPVDGHGSSSGTLSKSAPKASPFSQAELSSLRRLRSPNSMPRPEIFSERHPSMQTRSMISVSDPTETRSMRHPPNGRRERSGLAP